ncbi:MAG TPA: helicase-related protein [Verrucomicrobiae bacterium]|nr:helicase-related protein [Verrucomicrobiae bacterium]
MSAPPDTASALQGLKDFQRATVDYVDERFYGPDPTRRFLVADEVGLGKTLVARGVVARTIERLWNKVPRINIVYICSNADIARQNIDRLSISGCEQAAQATRLTLLPLHMHDLKQNRVNFVALTPATSFEQKRGGGRIDERVLLYWLLDRAWNVRGPRSSLYVMQDYANTSSFEWRVEHFDFTKLNEQISDAFVASLAKQVLADKSAGQPDLRTRFEELRGIFGRSDSKGPPGASKLRTGWIGEVRLLLAKVCLATLEPHLIILDEFQRFKHLLQEDSEAGELARDLFESEAGQGARVLLLSATPYRAVTLHHETDDDHYGDFLKLLGFLEDGNAAGCKEILAEYRAALPSVMTPEGMLRLRNAKAVLQQRLVRVMARTERLSSSKMRGGMLVDKPPADTTLHTADVRGFLGAQSVADAVDEDDVVEYWKSAPYLFNFMDAYALKRSFRNALEKDKLVKLVRKFPEAFLDLERARNYLPVEPANARLRDLIADTVGRGMWRLLWMPPSLPYYTPEGPFATVELANVTKRLVFSAWHMVPRAVASLVSYEAERRMMRAAYPRERITQENWKKQRGLLRFRISEGRHGGLPLLLLIYPCLTFARDCDPRDLARGAKLNAKEMRIQLSERIKNLVEKMGLAYESGGATDDRWYWLVPILLDYAEFPDEAQSWWERMDLTQQWAGVEAGEEDEAWDGHVEKARETITAIRSGAEKLGMPPEDLFNVLALGASAGPATAAMRAYARASRANPAICQPLRDAAARTGRAFLSLFNHAEVIEAVRTEFAGEPYWERVLEYAHAGNLQSVLDEYAHLLRESLGVASKAPAEIAEKIGTEIISALTIRAASLRIDDVTAPPYAREVKLATEPMRIRFAMRFGDDRADEEAPPMDGSSPATRKERVRAAFNSPFWPFVLVSTSVGQEGLDFHHYCHAITHWNLPSNPVDLEQREGRIHRYKGHAVRKNVSAVFATEALQANHQDAWESLFEMGRSVRLSTENDLVPYWVFQGDAKIERHVPLLPFSREVDRLYALRRALAIYRMVFGQSRQEDLITYLLTEIPEGERDPIVATLQIDLSPLNRPHEQTLLELVKVVSRP